jgi:protein-tyrosine phosphatase
MGQQSRAVSLGRSLNCRDVGGYPAPDGRQVRWGLLYRSDLPVLDAEHAPDLEALGLNTVIDLREPEERSARPSSAVGRVPRVLDLSFGLGPLVAADPTKAASLRALYRTAILELGGQIAGIVSALCRPSALPALVHCAAGKDRTGIVIGLVLSALGVPDEVVAQDYAVTADNLTATFFDGLNAEGRNARVDLTSLVGADVEEMLRLLKLVREVAGDARAYLVEHGVTAEELDRLGDTLLTAA